VKTLFGCHITSKVYVALEFKKEDLWVGAFWRTWHNPFAFRHDLEEFEVWVCLLPCFPIHLTFMRTKEE
jgi:hypothetical protein